MGIMLLPSLEERRWIRLENLSQTEAVQLLADFDARVKASRKLKSVLAPISDSYLSYNLLQDLESYDLEEILESVRESECPGTRGIRAVFIDEGTDTILVGTTVVYSANWATVGFEDDTIATTLLDLAY